VAHSALPGFFFADKNTTPPIDGRRAAEEISVVHDHRVGVAMVPEAGHLEEDVQTREHRYSCDEQGCGDDHFQKEDRRLRGVFPRSQTHGQERDEGCEHLLSGHETSRFDW